MRKIKDIPKEVVILDAIDTWPRHLLRELEAFRPTIGRYLEVERSIDQRAEQDVMLRINRPQNPYRDAWTESVDITNLNLRESRILGFHATRLLPEESLSILRDGLEPLSQDLLERRLALVQKMGLISNETRINLLANSQANAENRAGNVCMFHTLATCEDRNGLERLFGLFGGEALYWYFADDEPTRKILQSIGRPALVLCVLPFPSISSRFDVCRRILEYYWSGNDFEDFDSFTRSQVSVLSVLDESDIEFESLTGYSKWTT